MENAFPSKLRDATSLSSAEARLSSLQEAFLMCGKTQEARDCEWDPSTHSALAELLVFAWAESTRARNKSEKESASTFSGTAHKIFFIAQKFLEFNADHAAVACGEDWLRNLCGRLESASGAGAEEQAHLAQCLHWAYVCQPSIRPGLRRWLGLSLAQFSKYPSKRLAVAALLQVLVQIIQGFSEASSESKASEGASEDSAVPSELLELYREVLLPLHRPNGFFEWRDQLPLLQTYHEPLMACLLALLRRNDCKAASFLLPELFGELAEAWPEGYNANTAKEVILLHELEVLVTEGKGGLEPALAQSLPVLLPKLVGCIASDNWRLCEKVLGLWRVDGFAKLVTTGNSGGASGDSAEVEGRVALSGSSSGTSAGRSMRASGAALYYPPLMAALLRGGRPHWNPTVRRMTWLVLEAMQTAQPALFERTAEQVWGQPGTNRIGSKKKGSTGGAAAGSSDVIVGSGAAPASASSLLASAGFAQRPRPGVVVPDGRYRPDDDHGNDNQNEAEEASGDSSSSGKNEEEEAAAARAAIIDEHNRSGFPGRAMAPPPNVAAASSKSTSSGLPPRDLGRGGAMAAAPWAGKSTGGSSGSGSGNSSNTTAKAPVKLPPTSGSSLVQVPGRVGGSAPIPTGKAVSLTAAPWAKSSSSSSSSSGGGSTRKSGGFLGGAMSAAPWAKKTPSSSSSQKRKANLSGGENMSMAEEENEDDENGDDDDDDGNAAAEASAAASGTLGMRRMSAYMEACKPDEAAEAAQSARGWVTAQAQATPTLLPYLKFHDLVFGHELGRGSFSVVKYARQILKEGMGDSSSSGSSSSSRAKAERAAQARLGRSQWPEFAVKIVATEKIIAEGYGKNLVREIALLRTLSHPGIARMVSVFKWREGSYLVLEYASKGDLHGLVIRSGSLDVSSTQFVLGEAIAALCSVHDAGLVFGDLKPENLLVTEAGHVKLTDFGGCRPATAEAAESLKSSKTALGALRDGDWRSASASSSSSSSEGKDEDAAGSEGKSEEKAANDEGDEDDDDDDDDDDARVEGTVAYSAPEVVKGVSRPSFQADAWALGCVAYFCLRGRPPFFAEEDDEEGGHHENLKRAIVSFEGNNNGSDDSSSSSSSRCGVEFPSEFFTSDAVTFVAALLEPDPAARLSVASAAMHPFFQGLNVHRLHFETPRPLSVGAAPPPPSDAKWARRQHSSIWAPELAAYDFSGPSTGGAVGTGAYAMAPVPESSHERGASFLPAPAPKPQAKNKTSADQSGSLSGASLPLRARPGPRRIQPPSSSSSSSSSASAGKHQSRGGSASTEEEGSAGCVPLMAVRGVEGGIAEGSDGSENDDEE